jgi:DNA-binding transcriptional regulator YiaG
VVATLASGAPARDKWLTRSSRSGKHEIHSLSRVEHLTAPSARRMTPPCVAVKLSSADRLPNPWKRLITEIAISCDMSQTLEYHMNHDSAGPKQKRERFQQLTQNPKVKIGKVFAADVRKSRIHPTVKKLTAWRKANRLSQPKAVAVLGQYYFHITFASLRSWEEGRRSPNPHTAGILEKFLSDHPTVERPKK